MDDFDVPFGDLAEFIIGTDKADEAVVLAEGEREASAMLIETFIGPSLGVRGLGDGVHLSSGCRGDWLGEAPVASLGEEERLRLPIDRRRVVGGIELADGGLQGFL